MTPKHYIFTFLFAFSCFFMSSYAFSSEPKLSGTHNAWSSYKFQESGGDVCYMVSRPTKAEGNYTRRGDIFALITHRPAESTRNVFSYISGYTYKTGSDVKLEIDGKTYLLFTQDDTAWAPDAQTDNRIANAIKSGSRMVVKGTSSRGTATTDTFSLKGSTAAHNKISKDCR